MMAERQQLSRIESELLWQKWRRLNEIDLVLFDGDDTLWRTVAVFRQQMLACSQFLGQSDRQFSTEEWQKKIEVVNDEFFESHGVNPKRWAAVVGSLAGESGLDDELKDEATRILLEIYRIPLPFCEGTEETLELLRRTGTPVGVVTHANREWTWRKYRDWLRLDRYLPWDDVYIVDEDGHKTADSWRQAIAYFGCKSARVAIVGDSPRSDINPALSIGVRKTFLVEDVNHRRWSVHNQTVDASVRRISDLRELFEFGGEELAALRRR